MIDSSLNTHAMLLLIVLLLTLAGAVVRGQDLEWYQSEMAYRVVPPYTLAYSIFQDGILNPLLNATKTSVPLVLANTLNCGVLTFSGNLSQALEGSDTIRTTVDESITQLIQAISDWENKIKQSEIDLSTLRVQVDSATKQVNTAEEGMKEKEAGLASAEAAVRDAEKAMEDAMNCERKRRRRKRFLNGLLRPICIAFNQNGIRNAMQRQTDADTQYQSAKDQFESYQGNLNDLKSQQEDLKAQVAEGTTQIATLNSTLSQFKLQQVTVADISEQLKKVILHLATIFSKSTVLNEVISRLLDFELLITPLNTVYEDMLDNELVSDTARTNPISAGTITRIRTDIDKLVIKLPNMPFNMNGTSFC